MLVFFFNLNRDLNLNSTLWANCIIILRKKNISVDETLMSIKLAPLSRKGIEGFKH